MTRASTLVLALLILNTLLGVLCLVVARGERKSKALRLWGWGMLIYSAGLLITIPPGIPFALRKIIGNAMIAYAPILLVEGALAHTRFRLSRRWTTLAFLASITPILINHLGGNYRVLVDMLAPSPLANMLFVIAAYVLVTRPPADARFAARFVAGLFLYNVVVWSLRMYGIWSTIGTTNDRERADLTIALFAIAQLVSAVASTLGMFWIEVRNMEAALRRLAETDALTALPNRRATVARCSSELARAERHRLSLGMVVFDVDHFKRVNDTYGHQTGDLALQHVANTLRDSLNEFDFAGRIGGEEFVVLIVEENADGALAAANRLREVVASNPMGDLTITLSGGLSLFPNDGRNWDELFAAADARLYAAKHGGRNRVEAPARPKLVSASA